MIPSIRWRIGLAVFALVAAGELAVAVTVLEQVSAIHREQNDHDLLWDLSLMSRRLGGAELERYIAVETEENTPWDEDFFEILDAAGSPLARSRNVSAAGLGEPPANAMERIAPGSLRAGVRVRIWEIPHPQSRKGHRRIRIAELQAGEVRLRAANSLEAYQRAYWQLRATLARCLIGVSLLGAAGAWYVTRHSLRPVDALTRRARALRGARDGALPRTGSGDELDRLADVLNEMLGGLRAEVQRVRRVSADAAHSLRTPLAALQGALSLHLQGLRDPERRSVAPVLEIVDDTICLVNRLLLLERVESAPLDATHAPPIRLDALAEDLLETLHPVALEAGVTLKSDTVEAAVRGDATQLRTALLNLLENALRHTPKGGWIHVAITASARQICCTVEDSGPGLRADQLERVFERFYSDRKDGQGTGIGLPLARAIATAHGGSLVATLASGARFELRLPAA